MGLFNFIKNVAGASGQFVTKEQYEKNLVKQIAWSPKTLVQLRGHGVTEDKQKKLEYFFYTNTEEKAKNLNTELVGLNYDSKYSLAARGNNFVITGWTTEMQMSDSVVIAWTKQMVEIGYKNDCDFDGWGTSV